MYDDHYIGSHRDVMLWSDTFKSDAIFIIVKKTPPKRIVFEEIPGGKRKALPGEW